MEWIALTGLKVDNLNINRNESPLDPTKISWNERLISHNGKNAVAVRSIPNLRCIASILFDGGSWIRWVSSTYDLVYLLSITQPVHSPFILHILHYICSIVSTVNRESTSPQLPGVSQRDLHICLDLSPLCGYKVSFYSVLINCIKNITNMYDWFRLLIYDVAANETGTRASRCGWLRVRQPFATLNFLHSLASHR